MLIFFSVTGTVYPAFGVVFAKAIEAFSYLDPHERRLQGDRNALYLFIIAIVSSIAMSIQIYLFSAAASRLTARLRTLSFKAILRQDSESNKYYM
jgi:ATP-binding cassette subfamily B (MDR/TAP) protein 1